MQRTEPSAQSTGSNGPLPGTGHGPLSDAENFKLQDFAVAYGPRMPGSVIPPSSHLEFDRAARTGVERR